MNESMLLSLYCFVDDFVKGLEGHIELGQWHGERGPKRRLRKLRFRHYQK
jgi:hypothetical protein